jgi:hypothetical protein
VLAVIVTAMADPARAQSSSDARQVTFRFTPTKHAQIAIWLESADGSRFATLRLTEATCLHGIGNRPGASQMNSGYRWPYGRREGVLPVWAHRRAAAPGAMQFPRVIFQGRPEGFASRTFDDSTPDPYSCLSFMASASSRAGLDAISCPSAFFGDKGRFLTTADVQGGYGEPFQTGTMGSTRLLDMTSLYPPRVDVTRCPPSFPCYDALDVSSYPAAARAVLPNLDAISMPTPPGDVAVEVTFAMPSDWPDGAALAFLEINSEGDYNASYDSTIYPTPTLPAAAWDSWAQSFGYPFRGQPSVVFRLAVTIGTPGMASTSEPVGYGSLDGVGATGGDITALDATITDDPVNSPGSGADRLRRSADGHRLEVDVGPVTPTPDGGTDGGADAQSDAGAAPDAGADAASDGPPAGGTCVVNPDCPRGEYCGPQNRCTVDCLKDVDCPGTATCNSFGMCVTRTTGTGGGGCGCGLVGGNSGGARALELGLLALGAAVARRRRAGGSRLRRRARSRW